MGLTSVGFPLGANLENEDILMTAVTAIAYGGTMMVDKLTLSSDLRYSRMVATSANTPTVHNVRSAWYGICNEPLGIIAGGIGRFRFVGELPVANVSNAVALLTDSLCANHTNGTAGSMLFVNSGNVSATVSFGQKVIGMPTVVTASGSQRIYFDGIRGFGIHCASVVA